jgi:hypothetical protein
MKKLLKVVFSLGAVLALMFQFGIIQPKSEAMACGGGGEEYYVQIDHCSQYYTYDCNVWVIKCRHTGGDVCDVSEQFPCSLFCE